MDPMTILAIAQGVYGLGQSISSAVKRRKANQTYQPFKTPEASKLAARVAAENYYQNKLPNEDIYRANALRGLASGIEAGQRTSESSSDVAPVISAYSKHYADFEKNLAMAANQNKQANKAQYINSLQNLAQMDLYKWQDRLAKYNAQMGEAAQLEGAGGANIGSALSMGLSSWSANKSMKNQQKMFNDWLEWVKGSKLGSSPSNVGSTFSNMGLGVSSIYDTPKSTGFGFYPPLMDLFTGNK